VCLLSDFKSQILSFQTEGDRTIIDTISAYVDRRTDILTDIKRDRDTYPEPEKAMHPSMFIARRIRSLLRRVFENEPFKAGRQFDASDLAEYKKGIYRTFGYELTPKDNFAAFFENYDQLKGYLGADGIAELQLFIQRYSKYQNERFKVISTVIISLEKGLTQVDTNRSYRDIVKYINRTIESALIRLQQELTGTIRLGRRDENGNFINVYVKPKIRDGEEFYMIFGEGIGSIGVQKAFGILTGSQKVLVDKLYDVIANDFEYKAPDYIANNYKLDDEGHYFIKYRYMANRLDMEESNLRKQVNRIQQKVSENVPVYIN
jgi:hypothetical protein